MLDPNTSKIRKDVEDIQGTGFVSSTHGLVAQGLKKVQRGLVTFIGTTANVSITAVDMDRTFLQFTYYTSASNQSSAFVRGYLSTSTNIAFERDGVSGSAYVAWEVIEWR